MAANTRNSGVLQDSFSKSEKPDSSFSKPDSSFSKPDSSSSKPVFSYATEILDHSMRVSRRRSSLGSLATSLGHLIKGDAAGEYKDPMVAAIAEQISHTKAVSDTRRWYIIDPRTSSWIGYWDLVTSFALLFTAIVTPVEVGFLQQIPDDRWSDPLFLTNRGVDLVFVIDISFQFLQMYSTSNHPGEALGGGQWVDKFPLIARHYVLSGWFFLDFFAVGVSGFDIFSPADSGAARFKVFRAVRVLRLLKLIRLARGSRIFRRWEMRMSINYAMLSIANIVVMLLFVCHLFACVWGLQASFQPLDSWLYQKGYCVEINTACDVALLGDGKGWTCNLEEGWMCVGAASQYVYSLYWSIATVTSIGYGDVIATPLNDVEVIVCLCMMLIGSLLFAYLVGSFCGLAANLAPDTVRFRQDLTDLNKFLAANAIPKQLRYALREFMHQTVYLRRNATGNRLLGELAPKLRNEVALIINQKWLQKVDLLKDVEPGLVLELAFALTLQIFPPGESCPNGSLYIVSRGAAIFAGRAYTADTVWGEAEALLTTEKLRFPIPAAAVSYLFTLTLNGETLRLTMSQDKYPLAQEKFRHQQIKWIVRRGMVRAAEQELAMRQERFRNRKSIYMGPKFSMGFGLTSIIAAAREASGKNVRRRISDFQGVHGEARLGHGSSGGGGGHGGGHGGGGGVNSAEFNLVKDDVKALQTQMEKMERSLKMETNQIRTLLLQLVSQTHVGDQFAC